MCDINQQKCIQELFSDYFLLPGHTLALGSSRAKPEHVQPSFFSHQVSLLDLREWFKKRGGFSLCVHICWVMCFLLLPPPHTLDFGVCGGGCMFSTAEHGDCLVYKEQLS